MADGNPPLSAAGAFAPCDLAAGLALRPMTAMLATQLGEALAAIDPWVRYPIPAAALARFFADPEPGAPRLVIERNGRPSGVIAVRTNWLCGPYLQFLGLLPAAQGHGIGSALLGWFEGEAAREASRNAFVCASDFNAGALRFYERHGFARVAVLDDLVRDGRAEVLLRKRLA